MKFFFQSYPKLKFILFEFKFNSNEFINIEMKVMSSIKYFQLLFFCKYCSLIILLNGKN